MATCFLCGTKMVPRFEVRDHLRPHVLTAYPVEWCADCTFGCVAGSFTPQDVASFYTADYYTHGMAADSSKAKMSFSSGCACILRGDGIAVSIWFLLKLRA